MAPEGAPIFLIKAPSAIFKEKGFSFRPLSLELKMVPILTLGSSGEDSGSDSWRNNNRNNPGYSILTGCGLT